jgi:hypothetical protein
MVTRVHRPLEVITCYANDICRRCCDLSKQLQDIHVNAALFSEAYLKPHERFITLSDRPLPGKKRCIPHNHAYLPPLVSIEATGVCIPINSEVLLVTVCKSSGHAWNDADITELLSFIRKSILAGDLNAKHPFWNSVVCNPLGAKLLSLLHVNEFEISTPQCPTHYCPMGNGDVLDIVVHKYVRSHCL